MAKPKRVNAFLATLDLEKQQQERAPVPVESPPKPAQTVPVDSTPNPVNDAKQAPAKSGSLTSSDVAPVQTVKKKPVPQVKKPSHAKQVNLTIGEEREFKLDDLAYQYSSKKKRRVNRNDIVRYLIDTITIEELIKADLSKHEK